MQLTPASLISMFDGNAMIIMLVWGFLHTRMPFLQKLDNDLVPWVNAVGYVLVHLASPPAHAGVLGGLVSTLGVLGTAAYGGALSAVTSLLYDKFIKRGLDRIFPAQLSYSRLKGV